jgi:hypothetical protein
MREAKPLEKETSRRTDTHLIRTPSLQAIFRKFFNIGKALRGGFVKVLALFNLLKEPGFDECAAAHHDGVDAGVVEMVVVVLVGVAVAITDKVDVAAVCEVPRISLANGVRSGGLFFAEAVDEGGAFGDIRPVCAAGVALLFASAVKCNGCDT